MNSRIKEVRKFYHLSMEKFGEKLGVTKSTISLIESGTNNVSNQIVHSVCREFRVNEEWLRTGNGKMLDLYDNTMNIIFIDADPTSFKSNLIFSLSHLNSKQWELLEEIAKNLFEKR